MPIPPRWWRRRRFSRGARFNRPQERGGLLERPRLAPGRSLRGGPVAAKALLQKRVRRGTCGRRLVGDQCRRMGFSPSSRVTDTAGGLKPTLLGGLLPPTDDKNKKTTSMRGLFAERVGRGLRFLRQRLVSGAGPDRDLGKVSGRRGGGSCRVVSAGAEVE